MSKNYVKAVLDSLPALKSPIETLVLLAIAEYTSDETRLAWPSVATLARRTRLHERTVQSSLRQLEQLGLMSTTFGGQDHRGLNSASCYRLEFDHHGRPLDTKQPPKRALAAARARPAAAPSPPQPSAAVPMPSRLKKIPAAAEAIDIAAEKARQLAGLKKQTLGK